MDAQKLDHDQQGVSTWNAYSADLRIRRWSLTIYSPVQQKAEVAAKEEFGSAEGEQARRSQQLMALVQSGRDFSLVRFLAEQPLTGNGRWLLHGDLSTPREVAELSKLLRTSDARRR